MRKMTLVLIACLVLASGFSAAVFAQNQVYVLCYHSFLGKSIFTDFSPEVFQKHLKSLRDLGYRFVSWQDIVSNRIEGGLNVLITIDDGNRSIRKIYPILTKYDIKPVLFIYPNIISKQKYALTYSDLKEYAKKGATLGGHGWYHEKINKKLYNKSVKLFKQEIFKPKKVLKEKIGVDVTVFAYPYGLYCDETMQQLKEADYKYSFNLDQKPLIAPLEKNKNLLELPRYMVTKSSWKPIYQELKKNAQKYSTQSDVPRTKKESVHFAKTMWKPMAEASVYGDFENCGSLLAPLSLSNQQTNAQSQSEICIDSALRLRMY